MRNTLAVLCFLATTVAGFSQEKSFNLNQYKFPDYKRHELELNFNSSGSNDKETRNIFLPSGTIEKKDYSSSYNNSYLNLGYQYDHLTRKHIDYLSSTLSGNYNYSMSNNSIEKEVQSSPSVRWNINGFRKHYITENKFFIKGLTNVEVAWNHSKSNVTGEPDNKYNHNDQSLSVGLGFGVGRMEKVSDLWQAYYMLEKLNKQGAFNRELTEEDVFEFARLASRLKNKRFFDARLQKIDELKGLDSLLHQQGLIRNSDISYFTTLNDYWSYGNFQDRHSGMELIVQASPNYQRSYMKPNDHKAFISDKSSIISSASFIYTKQLNLYWQRGIGAEVSYESLLDSTGNDVFGSTVNRFATQAHLNYGYFPNSRTSIYGGLQYMGKEIDIQKAQYITEKSWRNFIGVYLSGNYYISPQLQLIGSISFSYLEKRYDYLDKIHTNYNLGLRYAIF